MTTVRAQAVPGAGAADASAAAARFDSLGDIARQMQIAHAAVACLGPDLKARYATLAMVTAGYRARRDADGQYALHAAPCVICTVTHKWPASPPGQAPYGEALPKRLLVRCGTPSSALDYAVPVDVQSLQWFGGVAAQRSNGILVETAGGPSNGAITCAIRVHAAQAREWYVMSALHVLTPVPPLNGQPAAGLGVTPLGQPDSVGTSTAYSGALRQGGISFDAQLAHIDKAWFNAAFSGAALGSCPPLGSRAELDLLAQRSQFIVLAPGNGIAHAAAPRAPILAQFCMYADGNLPIPYHVSSNGISFHANIYHTELIVLSAGKDAPVSEPGDSGSPVIGFSDGKAVFVGMLIAGPLPGSGSDLMMVLPAWQLLDIDNWSKLPAGTQKLAPAFSIP